MADDEGWIEVVDKQRIRREQAYHRKQSRLKAEAEERARMRRELNLDPWQEGETASTQVTEQRVPKNRSWTDFDAPDEEEGKWRAKGSRRRNKHNLLQTQIQKAKKKRKSKQKASTMSDEAMVALCKRLLLSEPSERSSLSELSSRILDATGGSWNKVHKKHFGSMRNYFDAHEDFKVEGDFVQWKRPSNQKSKRRKRKKGQKTSDGDLKSAEIGDGENNGSCCQRWCVIL